MKLSEKIQLAGSIIVLFLLIPIPVYFVYNNFIKTAPAEYRDDKVI